MGGLIGSVRECDVVGVGVVYRAAEEYRKGGCWVVDRAELSRTAARWGGGDTAVRGGSRRRRERTEAE